MSPMIEYEPHNFGESAIQAIARATVICREYQAQGLDLTLRQLYYQFVARAFLPNRDAEYKRLGGIINNARMAGLLDWDYIVDRTRNVAGGDGWMKDPAEVIEPYAYSVALWKGQPVRVEVWIEKEALVGVLENAAAPLRLPYFACRGYNSQSEAWRAARRLEGYFDDGAERVVVLHLGDHDPSGIDMTRDITDRTRRFIDVDGYDPDAVEIRRIALNMDQVRQYNPPPNPAKLTDSRVGSYLARFGSESWELDALNPTILRDLIQSEARAEIDQNLWDGQVLVQSAGRRLLTKAKDRWNDVVVFLEGSPA